MNKAELLELILNGENSGVEFKRDDLRPEQLAKEVVAFANFRGGQILAGVEDDGNITGIQREDLKRWVMDTVFGRKVHPMILPFYREVHIDDQRRVAIITISQGATKTYVLRRQGREDIYIRVGSTSRLASREQQAQIYALGGKLDPEGLPVSGSSLRDLSLERLTDYLSRIVGEEEIPDSDAEWIEYSCRLGLMVERQDGLPTCTIAGLVLLGYAPRRLLRTSGVRWMAFRGSEKTYDALDDRVIDGPVVALWRTLGDGRVAIAENGLIESLLAVMFPFISEDAAEVGMSMRRERHWLYPVEALREAILNALARRDWTRPAEAEVVRYADRIEILSPGGLQNSMTVDKIIAGRRSARNPLIAQGLRDYGYFEVRGMGVRKKILPLLIQQNGTEPDFIATEDSLRVVMHR